MSKIVEIPSFSRPGITYEIDLDKRTCTCPAFRKHPSQPCKHLQSLGGLFLDPPSPDPGEALSALIKSIRLRRTADAVTWLLYLWRIPNYRVRAQRRLLLSSAEDNLSISVMQSVSNWYSLNRFDFNGAVREMLRTMKAPNWYATERGRTYIRRWRQAELEENPFHEVSKDALLLILENAVKDRALMRALHAFNAFYEIKDSNRRALAQLLVRLSAELDNHPALELAKLFEDNLQTVWTDTNHSGQALYTMIVGPVGEGETPTVEDSEVLQLIAHARTHPPAATPTWSLDGIHTRRGGDARFGGVLPMMYGCCRAYLHFGRLDPEDRWLPEFTEAPDDR